MLGSDAVWSDIPEGQIFAYIIIVNKLTEELDQTNKVQAGAGKVGRYCTDGSYFICFTKNAVLSSNSEKCLLDTD